MDDHNFESSLDGLSLVIVEDEPLFRMLLEESFVSRFPTTTVLGSYATAEECLEHLGNTTFDVLLTDIDLGKGMNGPALGVHLRLAEQVRGVVLLSNLALPSVLSTLPPSIQGGWSYLLKPSVNNFDQLSRAIVSASQAGVLLDDSRNFSMKSARTCRVHGHCRGGIFKPSLKCGFPRDQLGNEPQAPCTALSRALARLSTVLPLATGFIGVILDLAFCRGAAMWRAFC